MTTWCTEGRHIMHSSSSRHGSRVPRVAEGAESGRSPGWRDEHLSMQVPWHPRNSRRAQWSWGQPEPPRGVGGAPRRARARWRAKTGLEHVPCAKSAQQEQRPRRARSTTDGAAQLAGASASPRIWSRRASGAKNRRLQARHGALGPLWPLFERSLDQPNGGVNNSIQH